jgi:hypothetical protein
LAVALAANAIVGLPQAFGDQAVSGLVLRRRALDQIGGERIRRTITLTSGLLALVTAGTALPAQHFTQIPGLAAVGAVLSIIIPVASHGGVSTSMLQRAGRQRAASVTRFVAALTSAAVWVPVMAYTRSQWGLVGFYVTTDALAAMVLWVLSRNCLPPSGVQRGAHVGSGEVLRFMAAVGPANCLNWLSLQGFGLLCAAGLNVAEYAELGLYLAILRVGLDLAAGPFAVSLQVGLSGLTDPRQEKSLIVRWSNQLTALVLLAVFVIVLIDPQRVLGWIGKEQFRSALLFWLLASLPMQAVSWLDRPVLINRHMERTDLHMRVWWAAIDVAIALNAGALGLGGLGAAVAARYLITRLAVDVWFGAKAPHCRIRHAWPSLIFAILSGIGIAFGHGRDVMAVVGGILLVFLLAQEVRRRWAVSTSTRGSPIGQ